MSNDSYKVVNITDGEGVVYSDFNDMQRFLAAKLSDQLLENLVGSVSLSSTDMDLNAQRGANAPTHLAYCLHGGSAYLRQGSANNKLQIAPGVLLQKVGNIDGNDMTFLPYSFAGTDEVTIANGDPSNPRIDLVQMKLQLVIADPQTRDFEDAVTGALTTSTPSKKWQVQLTLSVKSGAAAVSPVYPDPDPGFVAIAGVVVGATYAAAAGFVWGEDTAGAVAVVHDQRMPINVQAYREDPALYKLVTAWALGSSNTVANASNVTNDLRAFCGKAGSTGRLVGVEIFRGDALGVVGLGNNGSGGTTFVAMNNTPNFGVAADVAQTPYYTFEGAHAPAAGPTVQQSATNKIGPPLWTNGYRCPRPRASRSNANLVERLCLRVQSGSTLTTISDVVWHVAQGI